MQIQWWGQYFSEFGTVNQLSQLANRSNNPDLITECSFPNLFHVNAVPCVACVLALPAGGEREVGVLGVPVGAHVALHAPQAPAHGVAGVGLGLQDREGGVARHGEKLPGALFL